LVKALIVYRTAASDLSPAAALPADNDTSGNPAANASTDLRQTFPEDIAQIIQAGSASSRRHAARPQCRHADVGKGVDQADATVACKFLESDYCPV
jgi:hypothetical protein